MMFGNFLKRAAQGQTPTWVSTVSDEGVQLGITGDGTKLTSPLLQGYIAQLVDDGFASETADGIALRWDDVYAAMDSPGYAELPGLLGLPEFTDLVPFLDRIHRSR